MNIHNEMNDQLDQIAKKSAPPPHDMTFGMANGTLECSIVATDAIGCAVDRVHISLADHDRWDLPQMRKLADQLCKQLRYLVEPLQVIEVDADQPLIQARSQPPTQDAQKNSTYYELLVAPQTITLRRFSAPRGEPRHPTAMHLTREVLCRLLQDMAAASA